MASGTKLEADEAKSSASATSPSAVSSSKLDRTFRLEPLFVYGVKPDVRGGIFFASDGATVMYPAGCGVALFNAKVSIN